MRLFLMRHAQAGSGVPDKARQLTVHGLTSLSHMPDRLATQLSELDVVFVSPYLRTRQTIENFMPEQTYKLASSLTPDGSVEAVVELLQGLDSGASVLLVTHMPLIGQLSSWLKQGTGSYSESFDTAQIELLKMDYPAAAMATQEAVYFLDS